MTFHKYTKIRPIGHEDISDIFVFDDDEIVIQEKIDGANFRFMIKDGKIIFGSRSRVLEGDEDNKYNKQFLRCISFIKSALEDKDLSKYEGLIFYGENCVKHSMNYNWDKIPPFLGFDIYNLNLNRFSNYNITKLMYEELNIPMVPLITITSSKEIKEINDDSVPISQYSSEQAEGIVFKNYERQMFGKYVTPKFKESNMKAFGGSKKRATNDEELFVNSYVTNARIEKHIFKLIDDGEKLEMALMKYLPKNVWLDIWQEEAMDICKHKWTVSFPLCKKKMCHRCSTVLNNMITNNALNDEK